MGTRPTSGPAQTSCGRCRRQKRKCDKAVPSCSLCMRLGLTCKYQFSASSSDGCGLPIDPTPLPEVSTSFTTLSHIKPRLIQPLSSVRPIDVASRYFSTVETWFPVIAEDAFRSRLPSTWDEAPMDFSLLSLAVVLLTTTPGEWTDGGSTAQSIMSLYLTTKTCVALVDGAGIGSLHVVQTKVLVALFEAAHGFYPAAYISIGAAARSMEALLIFEEQDMHCAQPRTTRAERDELMLTWRGIIVLDRYITIEIGRGPPVTRGRALPELPLAASADDLAGQTLSRQRFLRLFDASTLADKIHTAIHQPMPEHRFKLEEVILILQTLKSLEAILREEISTEMNVYSSSIIFCTIGQLMALENGTKQRLVDEETKACRQIATSSLNTIIEIVVNMTEPFSEGRYILSESLPPFVTYLVYKTAALLTHDVQVDGESKNGIRQLQILRKFLTSVGHRWLGAKRHLALLNEDTTPRTLKAINAT